MPMAEAAAAVMPEAVARDAMLAWFRGEFAAANAIIDALCGHLALLGGEREYKSAFEAIHRRRLNWIPVLQMQKYHSISEITLELRRIVDDESEKKTTIVADQLPEDHDCSEEKKATIDEEIGADQVAEECGSATSGVTDADATKTAHMPVPRSQQDVQTNSVDVVEICDNHEDCEARQVQIKLTKGFNAKESVKSHMVNVVKGLKLYDNIFTDSELSKLSDFVNELRAAGQNGELSGDTFILFNQQIKGNRRELIQFGVPIFGQVKDDATTNQTSNIEPIPDLLQNVIDHLMQWKLIPEYKRPNGCIINFFEEGEYSQPFQKPPHLEQPISTLLLNESTMAFGRILSSDNEGNYKGALMLSPKEGTLLVMRGHSSDMARHVMCPSPSRRVSITLFRVRPDQTHCHSPTSPLSTPTLCGGGAMTLWQSNPYQTTSARNGTMAYGPAASMDLMPNWGMVHTPMVMLTPMVRPLVLSPRTGPPLSPPPPASPPCGNGTGVFLPWAMAGPKKPHKHLPPRAQRGRLLALPGPPATCVKEASSEPSNVAVVATPV